MAFDPVNWLDIWSILKYEIIGDLYLTIFICAIIIFVFCAKLNFNYQITTLIMVLFALVVSGMELGSTLTIYAYTVFFISIASYYLYSQAFKRG